MQTNLKAAIEHLQARYASLSAYAKKLRALHAPKPVIEQYEEARRDYMRYGNEVFAELAKRNLTAEQVVFRDGKPVIENGKLKTLKIAGPLQPPGFSMAGDEADVGAVFLIPALYIIGGIVIVSVGGYFTVKALEQISIMIRGPNYEPDRKVDAYLKVYDRLRQDGVPAEEAAKRAAGQTEPPSTGPGLGTFLLVGGAVAAGALVMRSKAG